MVAASQITRCGFRTACATCVYKWILPFAVFRNGKADAGLALLLRINCTLATFQSPTWAGPLTNCDVPPIRRKNLEYSSDLHEAATSSLDVGCQHQEFLAESWFELGTGRSWSIMRIRNDKVW